ncbi:hypothetical protein GCM10027174_17630 [Salinifilum aidingensis]
MSSEQLVAQAKQIEQRAAEVEYQQMMQRQADSKAPPPIRYEDIQQKYEGAAVPLFEPFTRIPDPSSYDAPIEDLAAAMEQLSSGEMKDPIGDKPIPANPDLNRIDGAGDTLEGWTGEAADNFKKNFLDPFPSVSKNQFLLLGVLKGALEADQARWQNTDQDIRTLAQETLDGLDNVASCGKNELKFVFSVASAVAAIGAVPFSAGASAGIAAVGAAGAMGAAGMDAAKMTREGGSVEQVMRSMKDGIDKLTKETRESGSKVARALNGVPGEVQSDRSAFVSARPALAGMEGDAVTGRGGLGGVN